MRMVPILGIALLALVLPGAAMAAHFADFYVLPSVAHTAGANGTFYIADISIQNFQMTPLTVDLLFIESGEGSADNVGSLDSTSVPGGSVTVPPRGSVVLKDVLAGYQGRTTGLIGAIMIRGNQAFAVTGRTYTNSAVGTVGAAIPPARDFLENQAGRTNNTMAASYIPGLVANSGFRTNLGMVAATVSSPMTVEVQLRSASGVLLGTRTFTIPAASFRHLQFSSRSISAGDFDIAGAEYRITSGDGAVAPYATVIDNGNGDSTFVSGVFPLNAAFGKMASESVFRSLADQLTSK